MRIDGKEYELAEFSIEKVDDVIFMFLDSKKKVFKINQSMLFIVNYLKDIEDNDISMNDLLLSIVGKYNHSTREELSMKSGIEKCINKLISLNILELSDE